MSDESRSLTYVNTPARAVMRAAGRNAMYYVYEYVMNEGWRPVQPERGYRHSTSAYAHLGRIVNVENQQAVARVNGGNKGVA